jgi:hypothetical protein
VTTVTVAVATEWFYFNNKDHTYETASLVAEVISAFLCNTIIILQFFPYHFKTQHLQHIVREALVSMKNQHNKNKTQEPDDSNTKMAMIYEENLYRY